MNAQVTVVIPTFQRPDLLRRAIASVVEQAGVKVRVRVFDNCSGDGTREVVDQFMQSHPFVEYHCHPSNLGAAANFDFAIRSVDTPYFSILSDDDYLLPGFLQLAVEALEDDADAAFWAGVTINVDEGGTIWDARVAGWPRFGRFEPPAGALALTGGMAPAWTSAVFRRSIVVRSGMPDPTLLGPSDLEFMLRLAARHPYLITSHPAAVFTLNSSSFSATQPLSAFAPGWKAMMGKVRHWDFLLPGDQERLVARLQSDFHKMLFRRGVNAIAAGRIEFANDASQLLRSESGQWRRAVVLALLAIACKRVPGVQRLTTFAYRRMEQLLVASRSALRHRYAALLRDA